jgi:hypothetical protein
MTKDADDIGNVVLDAEDILQSPIATFGPNASSGGGFNELSGDTHRASGLLQAASYDVCDAKLAAHFCDIEAFVPRRFGGRVGDYEQITETRKPGDDALCNSIRKVRLARVAGVIVKWQHNDRGIFG